MQHLTLEDFARLVDEEGTAEEGLHLELCAECTRALAGLRTLTARLAELPDPRPPHAVWEGIEQSLRSDARGPHRRPSRRVGKAAARAAAAIILFACGAAAGRLTSPAADGPRTGSDPVSASDLAGAAAALEWAEANYLQRLAEYGQLIDSGEGMDPVNRLAALEGIVLTTRAALREAPADPVINNYHLTALGHREALLRQLGQRQAEEWF